MKNTIKYDLRTGIFIFRQTLLRIIINEAIIEEENGKFQSRAGFNSKETRNLEHFLFGELVKPLEAYGGQNELI